MDEKLFGPVQFQDTPVTVEVKFKVCPEQSGVLLPSVGEAGPTFTVTAIVPAEPVHPATVAVTE